MEKGPLILIVGVCASGKTTLAAGLRELGYNAFSFAQEHSVSSTLWQRFQPDVLIVLHCRLETIKRRKEISWGLKRYRLQLARLEHAASRASLFVATDEFTPKQLIDHVQEKLAGLGIEAPTERGRG